MGIISYTTFIGQDKPPQNTIIAKPYILTKS